MDGGVGDSGGVGREEGGDGGGVDGEGVKGPAGQEQLVADAGVGSRGVGGPRMGEGVDNDGVRDCIREGLNVVDDPDGADALDRHVGGAVALLGDRLWQVRPGAAVVRNTVNGWGSLTY